MIVSAQCSRPAEIAVTITVDMSLGEWRRVMDRLNVDLGANGYFGPLVEIRNAINAAILNIEARETIKLAEATPQST